MGFDLPSGGSCGVETFLIYSPSGEAVRLGSGSGLGAKGAEVGTRRAESFDFFASWDACCSSLSLKKKIDTVFAGLIL